MVIFNHLTLTKGNEQLDWLVNFFNEFFAILPLCFCIKAAKKDIQLKSQETSGDILEMFNLYKMVSPRSVPL